MAYIGVFFFNLTQKNGKIGLKRGGVVILLAVWNRKIYSRSKTQFSSFNADILESDNIPKT